MDNAEVGKRLRYFREKKKMNRNALANAAGGSPTYIYQLEKGEKSPTVEYLGYICDALKITLPTFFGDTENMRDLPNKVDELTPVQKELLNDFLNSLR